MASALAARTWNELAWQFYAEMCPIERWSAWTLRDRVRGMLFERTVISRLPEATIRQDLQRLPDADRLTYWEGLEEMCRSR